MGYRIAKRFQFEAAHALTLVPDGHPCRRLHGHSYTVEVALASDTLNGAGMVRDYGELHEVRTLIAALDHQNLNAVLSIETTAENLAMWLYQRITYPELAAVRVAETASTWAEYRGQGVRD